MLRRGIADPTASDLQQATDALRSSDRGGLWAVLSRGVHMRVNTIQALLWACCSPHDFGMPEVSPLCEALRSGDDTIVLMLLQHRASPSRREEGNNDLIFVAIQMNSAENVQRLLQFSADPRSREAIPTREGHAGRRRLMRRTALEAAAAHPRCQRVIREFMIGI